MSVDLRGLKALQKKVESLKTAEVEVGFFPEDKYGPENNNLNVAAVALMQERGAMEYPSRPFFTQTVEDKMVHLHLARAMSQAVSNYFRDGRSLVVGLKKIGNILKDEVQIAIEDYPGSNSPSWAAYKKSQGGQTSPLQFTDTMLNSVKVKIKR